MPEVLSLPALTVARQSRQRFQDGNFLGDFPDGETLLLQPIGGSPAANRARCYAWGMARYRIEAGRRGRGSAAGRITLVVILLVVLIGARSLASYAIEIAWWKELGQFNTWLSLLTYSLAPVAAATVLAFVVLWMTHARALKFAGARLGEHVMYGRISALVLLFLGYLISTASVDTWTVVRFAGSRGLPPAATAQLFPNHRNTGYRRSENPDGDGLRPVLRAGRCRAESKDPKRPRLLSPPPSSRRGIARTACRPLRLDGWWPLGRPEFPDESPARSSAWLPYRLRSEPR